MDSRTALQPQTTLHFNQDAVYTIRGEIGRGGSCIVYDGSYRTHAGDEKTVRIKECYPFDLRLERSADNTLRCAEADLEPFLKAQERMFEDFRLCNTLFYADPASDSIINTLNIYQSNNTVYVVSSYSRENILSNCSISSLRDCASIVKQTAYAIECIHEAGYLYLDTKPDNISVIHGYANRIQLFDFDSLIPISAIRESGDQNCYRLSYTKGFAALELRRGQLSKLGTYTDIYGIGALLFWLLFGHTPEAPDCSSSAIFNFSKLQQSGPYPDRLLMLLENFFRMTLSGYYPDRYARMRDAVSALEEIERLADPALPYIVSTPMQPLQYFIGRENETALLEAWARDPDQRVIAITGMGGIGKSTFIRHFLRSQHNVWDSVIFLYARRDLRQTILNDDDLRISTTERFPEEKEEEYYFRKLRKLREIAQRDRVLLVIDNFEDPTDPDLPRLVDTGCKLIFITRQRWNDSANPTLNLEAIEDTDRLRELFTHHLGRNILPEESESVEAILRSLAGHTLAIELFARQITNSYLSLNEAGDLLRTQGLLHTASESIDYLRDGHLSYDSLSKIITGLFAMDRLSAEQKAVLKLTGLFPAPGIAVRDLMRLAELGSAETINQLYRSGWIMRENQNIYLHPLIRDVVHETGWTAESLDGIQKMLDALYKEISDESHKEELLPSALPPGTDPYAMVTDHVKLFRLVQTAENIIESVLEESEISNLPIFRQLWQATVINLPWYEDELILRQGHELLSHPDHLEPVRIIEIYEKVGKTYLNQSDFETAETLFEEVRQRYTVDDRTRAEYYTLLSTLYDYRNDYGDTERMIAAINKAISYARKAPRPRRKHLLAELLLGKLNLFCRCRFEDETGLAALIREIEVIVEHEVLPYSEIMHGFMMAMGYYYSLIEPDPEQAARCIQAGRLIAEKLYPAGIDTIDYGIIPPARIYLDLGDLGASEKLIREGISICDEHIELAAYIRKKHELHQCLLDIYLGNSDIPKCVQMLELLDSECRRNDLPDTVWPEIRKQIEEAA